jgi:hypothetical protein
MSDPFPWEDFTRPVRGDANVHRLYEHLGRAIAAWEHVEYQLSRLYSFFGGALDSDELIRAYGKGRIFSDRLSSLRKAANEWFTKSAHQGLEGDFDKICLYVEGFSTRRNEIAHAVVFPTDFLSFFLDSRNGQTPKVRRWAVIPPYYLGRKHQETTNVPSFVYSTPQLRLLTSRFIRLARMIDAFLRALFSRE